MQIAALGSPRPVLQRAPLPASSGPKDRVELAGHSGPPDRKWLWTSLESAGLLSGSGTGPLAAALTRAQREALIQVAGELERKGLHFQEDRGFWNGILSQRHVRHRPEAVLEALGRGGTLSIQGPGGENAALRNLADLRDAAALYGVEPAERAGKPEVAGALASMAAEGFHFHLDRDYSDLVPTGRLGAYRCLLEGSPYKDAYHRNQVGVSLPGRDSSSDELWLDDGRMPAVDFFYGSGTGAGLKNLELASGLKDLRHQGVELQLDGYQRGFHKSSQDPYQWYWGLVQGQTAQLLLHDTKVENLPGQTRADLDEILRRHREWQRVDREVFQPAVQSGVLSREHLKDVVWRMSYGEGLEPERKARLCLGVMAADKDSKAALNLYHELGKLGLKGEAFAQAVERSTELTREFGAKRTVDAARFLEVELPKSSPYEAIRAQSREGYLKLLRYGAPHHLATEALSQARLRVDDSTGFDRRVDILGRMLKAGMAQKAYAGLEDDYRAILENRRPGEDLASAARPLIVLLESLAPMGKAEQARETYRFIRQGLEQNALAGTEQELVGSYLETLLLTSPEEARKALETVPDKRQGAVKEEAERVAIGGVVVPKKKLT
ncbi:MAG: hypothetical protein AB1758_16795 [Candidatus Eremiobacterota bacterium]